MTNFRAHEDMILQVANKLGGDLIEDVAFIGGSTAGLHITDQYTLDQVRFTEDVDLIVHVVGYLEWHKFSQKITSRGFVVSPEDDVICRFRLGELCVDFMPDDEATLGFSNRWYQDALKTAIWYPVAESIDIRLVTPLYFLLTKLEAFKGRGNGDMLSSRDIEDIMNLINGREELLAEIELADDSIKQYAALEIQKLLAMKDMGNAIDSATQGDVSRGDVLFERLERIVAMGL